MEHIIVKRVIPRGTEITNYHGVDGDYDFSTTASSISTDLAPMISPIVLVIDCSAYIGYIRSVCVAVAIGRSGSFMVDVKKWQHSLGLMGGLWFH